MTDYRPPKGMKDFCGKPMRLRQRMLDAIRKVYERWGYQPLSTPAMENLETLKGKAGNEIAGQIFRIEESEMGLRFDLTVPLARFASSTSLPKPYKRYCIAPVWRREEPQKGRLREFLQADADIIGTPGMRAEAELLAMSAQALQAAGIGEFEILLNDRRILSGLISKMGIENEVPVFRALDKLDKIGKAAVEAELIRAGMSKTQADKLLALVAAEKKEGNAQILAEAQQYSPEGASELSELLSLLKENYGLENARVELSLVRGLDYYTGPIFEIKASAEIGSVARVGPEGRRRSDAPAGASLAGGGRYDNLLGTYGQKDYAVGISLGIERLMALQEEKAKASTTSTQVYVACFRPELYGRAVRLAGELREAGIAAETDLNDRPMQKQLAYANALGIPFALIVGQKEADSGKYALKNLKSGEQKEMEMAQIIDVISEMEEEKENEGQGGFRREKEN